MPSIQEQLILHEDLRLKPYRCTSGKLTIGVGRNLDDKGLTRAEALVLLDNDIAEVTVALRRALPWFDRLDSIRQRVLIDMGVNLGVPGLLKFKRTLKAVEEGRWLDASIGMGSSRWAKQVKTRAARLMQMMLTGEDYDA